MKIIMEWVGRTPLLQHDPRLSDPDDPIVREIKALTSKRTKTEQDRREIERLEWFGGLVLGEDGPAVKTAAIHKCLQEAAKITKQGKQVKRALAFGDLSVPLQYDGPRDPKKLWELAPFRNRMSVGIGNRRTMRMRPQFLPWKLIVSCMLLDDALDFQDLSRIADLAGTAEGLGDYRVGGYGRFAVKIQKG